jgi:hypothetical protein
VSAASQIVAIDACDPTTFNAALGPDFCRNVTLAGAGQAMTLSDSFSQAAAGTPNPGWDFAPDAVSVVRGIPVSEVNQGGEPHTFTEVQKFVGDSSQTSKTDKTPSPSAPTVSPIRRSQSPECCRAASFRSRASLGEPITSGAASTRGCARKSS